MAFIKQSVLLCLFGLNALMQAQEYGTLRPEEYDRPGAIDPDIKEMVSRMTLPEKIGQMTQLDQAMVLQPDGTLNKTAVEYYAQKYYVGSYLNQLAR